MARQSTSARAAAAVAAGTTNNTIANSVAIESIADVTAAKMEVIVDYLQTHDRSTERIKWALVLLKAIPGLIPTVDEYLMVSRLLVETRVSRARPAFSPDTLRRRRVGLKDATLNQIRAAYQAARDRFLANLTDDNSKSSDSAHSSSPPALAPTAKVNSSEPQQSAQKAVKVTSKSKPTLAQPLTASTLKTETPKIKTPKAERLLKQTTPAGLSSNATAPKTQVSSINTAVIEAPKVALPVVESPSPATKIFASESAKYKTRRSRNKKTKVPASPLSTKKTKEQAVSTPRFPSSDFDFRASPTKQALAKVDANVPAHASNHVRNVSDSSSTSSFIFAGRSRGASSSSSSLDEDKPSTGKTTPHRLSEASEIDKPLDLFTEFAPEHFVEADLTFLDEASSITDETTATSVTEVVTVDTSIDEEVDSLSVEEALLAAVANDTSPAFIKRTAGQPSSKEYEDVLPSPLSTFGKTAVMVKQMMDDSDVDYYGEDVEAHNIELMSSLDLYHHSALPMMTLSTDQVKEEAAFKSAMVKHRNDLMRHAAQEMKAPQTKADAQMSALFSIGLQSVEKNGTIFFNPQSLPSRPIKDEILDTEQDPAIVSMIASHPSGTGLSATLTKLGPNRPLASWRPSTTPTIKSQAPIEIPDIKQDPAIISISASHPPGTGLSATLTKLGPNRPLASWHPSPPPTLKSSTPKKCLEAAIRRTRARAAATSTPSTKGLSATLKKLGPNRPLASWRPSMLPMIKAQTPLNNLEAAISRMREREAAKSVVAHRLGQNGSSLMRDSPVDAFVSYGFSAADLAEL